MIMRQALAMLVMLGVGLLGARGADETGKSGLLNEELRKLVESVREKTKVPAVGVIVTSSKGVLALQVDGLRKAGTKIKVQPGDKFHMGSNTKAFTALLVAILVQRKQLSYGLSLKKAFPEYADTMAPSLRTISLDLLLRHRAGLPNDVPNDWWDWVKKGTTPRQQRQALMKAIFTDKKADLKPDVVFHYSNLGYVIAGAMVERVMNDSYESLLRKHVLNPLKMTTAGFGPMTMNKLVVEQPWGHEDDGEPFTPSLSADNPPVMAPAVRLHCSLADWAKYAQDQLKGARGEKALLPAAVYKNLQEPDKDENYTRGAWIALPAEKILPSARGNVLMHDGSNTYNYASALLDPTRDYAVLVVANQGKKKAEAACGAVRNAVLGYMLSREAAAAKKETDKTAK
jgi:CubicO group peptidase (beta-lactamase class C family)